jgi:hypothetical protein
VNKQEFSTSSWRSNQGYTKMYSQPTIKIVEIVFTGTVFFSELFGLLHPEDEAAHYLNVRTSLPLSAA